MNQGFHDRECESELTSHGYTPCRCDERAWICWCRKNQCEGLLPASPAPPDEGSVKEMHEDDSSRVAPLIGLEGHDLSRTENKPLPDDAKRTKGVYIGAPACFALEEAIRPVCEAFGVHCCYVVGSSLQRADWRDVDVRLILDDAAFAAEFPDVVHSYEHDARWLVLTVAISERLSRTTGLPIDFQIQPQTHANDRHKGRRNAIGLRFTTKEKAND